jgi:hypothetical protein
MTDGDPERFTGTVSKATGEGVAGDWQIQWPFYPVCHGSASSASEPAWSTRAMPRITMNLNG